MKSSKSPRRRGGFTLIEVLLVLMILAGLAALAVTSLGGTRDKANIDMTKTRLQKILNDMERYYLDIKAYPTEEEGGLSAMITKPSFDDEKKSQNWAGPYLQKQELKDFWDNDLKYELVDDGSGRKVPHLSSNGPDGQEGTEDDIKSWSEDEEGG
ncbi:MAG: type II secretion system major pseudopilin GspG [Planctomycetes bacterium]|nr:type II secretion system major pseudopilin GspG [Planctomycetota bacterium]